MSKQPNRRDMLSHTARGAGLVTLGGAAAYLAQRAIAQNSWQIDSLKCINAVVGVDQSEACEVCADTCVLPLSAVRAVNDHEKCGRCCICPAYYEVTSPIDEEGMPSVLRCPRDAIERKPIGYFDKYDPYNNYYEYIIDEEKCNGCGRCVMGCKEPAGLGSIRLEVRYDLCLDCNRCSIAKSCPEDAYVHEPLDV